MYFPVLRSRQEELIALDDCRAIVAASGKIIPIIEPAALHPIRLTSILASGVTCCFIVNPGVGTWCAAPLPAQYLVLASHPNVIPTMIIGGAATAANVAAFVAAHSGRKAFYFREAPPQHAIVTATIASAAPTYVIIENNCIAPIPGLGRQVHVDVRDVFNLRNNADYPADEHFTFRHDTINIDPQFGHFGDYSIAGSGFPTGIQIARAAAAHVVYAISQNPSELRIKHYVAANLIGQQAQSMPTLTLQAIAGVEADRLALNALATHNDTPASLLWQNYLNPPHNPGLGMVKRIAVRHHLELMSTL